MPFDDCSGVYLEDSLHTECTRSFLPLTFGQITSYSATAVLWGNMHFCWKQTRWAQLRSLAKAFNIKRRTIEQAPWLIQEIRKQLTFVSMETAAAVHPILAFNMPKKSVQCAERVEALVRLSRQGPTVYVHAGWAIEQLEAHMRTLIAEEIRAAHAAEKARSQPPAWMADALTEAPTGPHYKITLRTGEQEHDGYCTGTEEDELYVSAWEESTVNLPMTAAKPAEHLMRRSAGVGVASVTAAAGHGS